MKPLIIAIAGGSASGKSTVVEEIVENLNIPQIQILYDWYGLHMDEFNCLKWRTDNKIQHLKYSIQIIIQYHH
mgnify:CR=1 FL=1